MNRAAIDERDWYLFYGLNKISVVKIDFETEMQIFKLKKMSKFSCAKSFCSMRD